jgi:hypothetical protein
VNLGQEEQAGMPWRSIYLSQFLASQQRMRPVRALTWNRVHLAWVGAIPPHIEGWRSVRATGDTKTRKPLRTL